MVFAVLVLSSLTACGVPLAWVKPGTGGPEAAADQGDCQRLAWRQAVEMENDIAFRARMFQRPMTMARPGFSRSAFNRYDWEDRFYSTCMQAKGYRLEPIPRGG